MKKSVLMVLAVILVFTGVFTGVTIWQHNRSMSSFAADGYVLGGEAETGVVSCDYFSAGTRYSRNYDERMVFTSTMGGKESVDKTSFIHYTDESLSSFSTGILVDMEQVASGIVNSYFVDEKMVLTKEADGYSIDNNGTDLQFGNLLWMVDDMKFLVYSDTLILTLPNGSTQEVAGYLEAEYIDDSVVQICNEEQIWQTVPTGASITLDNGVVIDLATGDITGGGGTVQANLSGILADLMTGGGVAIASTSAQDWRPPEFEFEAIDGQDGEDGEDGEEGEAGEAGEEGEAGEAGEEGESGEDGDAGEEGQSGSDGVSGGSGESGEKGQGGAAGGSAAPGAAGSTEVNSALAQVLISSLEYDCAQMDISFYAVEADTLVPGTAWLQVIESDTNQEVARRLVESWETDLAASSSIETVNVHVGNLQADTRYTVLIYSGYKVGENGTEGEKVFASRTFYTSDDGVEMKLGAVSENAITVDLDRQDYSTIQSGKLCVTFTYTDETGTTREYRLWSDSFDLGSSPTQVLPLLDEEGNPVFEGLKSNIPFTVELFTSTGAYNVTDGRWEVADDDAAEPDGVAMGTVDRSDQVLEGKTLKETPTYGSLQIYQSTQGCYMISVNDIQDPDTAIQNYNYKIYSYDMDTGKKKLVKQLYSATGSPVELYVDEDVIEYNHWYYVECTINYHDNEKPYSLIVTNGNENPFQTGTGQAVITFVEGTVEDSSRYNKYSTVGPSHIFGNLLVDTSLAGFDLDLGQTGNTTSIRVDVSSGGDYVYSMSYDEWDAIDWNEEEDMGAELDGAKYDADNHRLYLPVDLWGLKEGSAYTFSVYAYVKYSDASSAYKYIGNTLAMTQEYGSTLYSMEKDGDSMEKTLDFTVTNLTGAKLDPDSEDPEAPTYDSEFAVGITLRDAWGDSGYPLELTSLRALEITVTGLDNAGNPIGSSLVKYVDLYEKGGLIPAGSNTVTDPYIWLSQEEENPPVAYLAASASDPSSSFLCTLSTADVGDVSAYTNVRVEVTGAYDYTYQMSYGFPDEASCNVSGYYNDIPYTSNKLNMDIAGDNTPSLNDYDYRENRDEAVDAYAIRNTGNTGSGFLPITDIGDMKDTALAEDTIRGYRMQADFRSSTMDSITYHIFTYDDWVAYGGYQDTNQDYDTDIQDIVLAAMNHAETPPQGDDVINWSEKVISITIPIDEKEWESIEAPFLDVIYVDDPNEATKGTEAEKNEETGGYVYYTNRLKRGQTYLFSFSEWDRCEQDEEGNPLYHFPYDDILYAKSNKSMIRSKPQQMDRQAPEVQMSLDHTTLEGEQVWSFTAYDPDQALGIMGKDGSRKIWLDLYNDLTEGGLVGDDDGGATWSYGYILGVTGAGMQQYTFNGFPELATQEALTSYSIAKVDMPGSSVGELTSDEVKAVYGYTQSAADHTHVMEDASGGMTDGISWKGTFTLTPSSEWSAEFTIYSIHLGRILNDSAYVTNDSAADTDPYLKGAGYKLNSMSSLRYMAAATTRYEKVRDTLKPEDGGSDHPLELEAQLVGGNLQFYVASNNELEERIVALEVTAWLDMGEDGREDWQLQGTKRLNYTPSSSTIDNIVASFNIADMGNYKAARPAAVQVQVIYDTGLYGSRQDIYMRTDTVQTQMEEGGLSWLWNAEPDGDAYSYLARQQKTATWYAAAGAASYSGNTWKLSGARNLPYGNLVWQYDENKDKFASKTGEWYLTPYDIIGGSPQKGQSRVYLENAVVKGTGYLEDTAYTNAAAGGWTDRENNVPVVLGALGMSDASLKVSPLTPEMTLNEESKTILGETFEAGTLFTFTTPPSEVQFSETLTINSSMDTATVTVTMPGASLKKMDKDNTEREYEFYPYLFLELREDTKYVHQGGDYYEGGDNTKIYRLSADTSTHGNILNDKKYFGSDVVGAAAEDGTLIYNGEGNAALKQLPAIDISKNVTEGKNTFRWIFRNLEPELNGNTNYSLRVYVLPVRGADGSNIDYSKITTDDIDALKHYVLDYTTNITNNTNRYYGSAGYNCWFRLRTNSRNTFKSSNPTPAASYVPRGYANKTVQVSYEFQQNLQENLIGVRKLQYTYAGKEYSSGTIYEQYVEYRLLDSDGEPVRDHADVMKASGYVPVTAKVGTYNPTSGDEEFTREITIYIKETDPSSVYKPTASPRLDINGVASLLSERILKAGETYTLQARICYTDVTLQENLASDKFVKTSEKWDKNTETQDVILSENAEGTGALISINFTIPTGNNPTQSVGATYTNNTPEGMDMSIRLIVGDEQVYNTGVWGENGVLYDGEIYAKILDKSKSGEDVSGNFSSDGEPLYTAADGYKRLDANVQHNLLWSKNPNYEHVYYSEIWGTINGIKHRDGTCECGQTHAGKDVDKYGNILLATSTPGLDRYLTMPDKTGIAILDAVVTYNATKGTVELNVLAGSGIEELKGAATLTVVSTSGGSGVVTVSTESAQWNGSVCTFTIPQSEKGKITGNCSASYTFSNENGTVTYAMSQGFVAN